MGACYSEEKTHTDSMSEGQLKKSNTQVPPKRNKKSIITDMDKITLDEDDGNFTDRKNTKKHKKRKSLIEEKKKKPIPTTRKKDSIKSLGFKTSMLVTCINKSPQEDYDIPQKPLGEGGFGKVYKVKQKSTGLIRAMKKIPRFKDSRNKDEEIINEIETLKKLDHQNIVKIFEYYIDDEGYYLITEYCSGGELFDLIYKANKENKGKKIHGGFFSEALVANIMYQIFNAVYYCHSTSHIIHRDLKPENILIESKDEITGFYHLKIIDFGTAKIYDKNKKEDKIIGSPFYIAPEVLRKNYNEKCDIWSCGVILYMLLVGKPPFYGNSDNEIIQKITEGKYKIKGEEFSYISEDAKDLIKKCLEMQPSKRISAKDAMEHKFFKKNDSRKFFEDVSEYNWETTLDNLTNFKPKNKLQDVALGYLVHNFPNIEEIKIINKVYNLLNVKQNGKLDQKEMKKGLKKYMTDKSSKELDKIVEDVFRNVDGDENGYIECEEFQRAGIDKKIFLDEKVLKFIFNYFDKDGSGGITHDELKEVFGVRNDPEAEKCLQDIIDEIDANGDGEISLKEFKMMMDKIII